MQKLRQIYRYRDAFLALSKQPVASAVHWKELQKSLPKLVVGLETLQIAQYLHIKHKESQFPILWKELCKKSIVEGQITLALYFQRAIPQDESVKKEVLGMIENRLFRKDQRIRKVFLRRWLKLLVSMELDSPDDYIKKAVFMIIESDQEFLMDCLLEHPTYSSRIPYVTVLRKLIAKKHSKVFEIYQHSKKLCVLPADLLDAMLDHYSREIDLKILLTLYSDLKISRYPFEGTPSLLKALNACYRIGDVSMAYQFLRNSPESLQNQEIFDLVLKICMVHDEASGLQRLASLICDGSLDIGLTSVSKLTDQLIRLSQFNTALELIKRYRFIDVATKLFHSTISSNPDIAMEVIKSGFKVDMGYGYLSQLYNHMMKNKLAADLPTFYTLDTSLISQNKHLDALDMALSEKNLGAAVAVVQASFAIGFSIPDEYLERIEKTFAKQYHPALFKLFLLAKKDIPETCIARLKDDFAKSRLRRVAACLKLLKKHQFDYYPFLPSLVPRLSSVLSNHNEVFERFRFFARLERMEIVLALEYPSLTNQASRIVSFAVLDHPSEALEIIKTSRFLGIPIHYPIISVGLSKLPADTIISLWENHPTLLDYPKFCNEVLFRSLVLQNEDYCKRILSVYKEKKLLSLKWCSDFVISRKSDAQRKLFFKTIDSLGLFRQDREWTKLGLFIFRFGEDTFWVKKLRRRRNEIHRRYEESKATDHEENRESRSKVSG